MDDLIKEKLLSIMGTFSWKVWKSIGSFLFFEFGAPIIEINEPRVEIKNFGKYGKLFPFNKYPYRRVRINGELCLWIEMTNWKVFVDEKEIAFEESSDKKIEYATHFLEGQKIIKIEINVKPLETIFYFDLNTKIKCFNESYKKNDTAWLIKESNGQYLAFRQDGKFSHTSIGEDNWMKLENGQIKIEI